jgi:hypothetical protein
LLSAFARGTNDDIYEDGERNRFLVPLIGRLFNTRDRRATTPLVRWVLVQAEALYTKMTNGVHPNNAEFDALLDMLDHPQAEYRSRHWFQPPERSEIVWYTDGMNKTTVTLGKVITPDRSDRYESMIEQVFTYARVMRQGEVFDHGTSDDASINHMSNHDLAAEAVAGQAYMFLTSQGAADALDCERDKVGVTLLTGLLDEYDRITGRNIADQQVSTEDLRRIAELVQG